MGVLSWLFGESFRQEEPPRQESNIEALISWRKAFEHNAWLEWYEEELKKAKETIGKIRERLSDARNKLVVDGIDETSATETEVRQRLNGFAAELLALHGSKMDWRQLRKIVANAEEYERYVRASFSLTIIMQVYSKLAGAKLLEGITKSYVQTLMAEASADYIKGSIFPHEIREQEEEVVNKWNAITTMLCDVAKRKTEAQRIARQKAEAEKLAREEENHVDKLHHAFGGEVTAERRANEQFLPAETADKQIHRFMNIFVPNNEKKESA